MDGCAAPFILGKRGYLNGKSATCYPGFENQLIGANTVNQGVVRDGKIITGRAMGSSHDFALEIIEAARDKRSLFSGYGDLNEMLQKRQIQGRKR